MQGHGISADTLALVAFFISNKQFENQRDPSGIPEK